MSTKFSITKKQAIQQYEKEVLPEIVNRFEFDGVPDIPARRSAWNDLIDSYIKSGYVPEERAECWSKPHSACLGKP